MARERFAWPNLELHPYASLGFTSDLDSRISIPAARDDTNAHSWAMLSSSSPRWTMRGPCLHFPPWGCLRDGAQFRKADSNSALLFTGRNESGSAGLRESRRQPRGHVRKSCAPAFAPSASIARPFSARRERSDLTGVPLRVSKS